MPRSGGTPRRYGPELPTVKLPLQTNGVTFFSLASFRRARVRVQVRSRGATVLRSVLQNENWIPLRAMKSAGAFNLRFRVRRSRPYSSSRSSIRQEKGHSGTNGKITTSATTDCAKLRGIYNCSLASSHEARSRIRETQASSSSALWRCK